MNRHDYYRHVRLMHETMKSMNDEGAYDEWIYTMPDEPTKEDFLGFTDDREAYFDLVAEFHRIFNEYADGGVYKPDPEVENFVKDIAKAHGVEVDIIF